MERDYTNWWRMTGKAKLYFKNGDVVEGNIVFDGKDEIYITAKIDGKTHVIFKHELLKVILDNGKTTIRPVGRNQKRG